MTDDVAVVVPYRPDHGPRDQNWAWLRDRWAEMYPDWPVRTGGQPDGPWVKAHATAAAVDGCTASILVIADADVWLEPTEQLLHAVSLVRDGAPWAIPHNQVRRLTEPATARFADGARDHQLPLTQPPYTGVAGGGLIVITRDNWKRVGGFDPRFEGWGGEDSSFARAADTLLGRHMRLRGTLWHLWHPPQQRLSRNVGSLASQDLSGRYQRAAGRRDEMQRLVNEHKPKKPKKGSTMDDLSTKTLAELRTLAKERGLVVSGTKPALIARLTAEAPGEEEPDGHDQGGVAVNESGQSEAVLTDAQWGTLTEQHSDGRPDTPDPAFDTTPANLTAAAPAPAVSGTDAPAARAADDAVFRITVTAVRPEFVDRRWHEKNHKLLQRRAANAGKTPAGAVRLTGSKLRAEGRRTVTEFTYEMPVK